MIVIEHVATTNNGEIVIKQCETVELGLYGCEMPCFSSDYE